MCHSFGTRHFAHESPLIGMVDSNYTNDDDTKSTSGYVFYFHGCPILTDSSKQRAVSNSTTEAELIAASRCARTCVYLRRLLADFGARNLPLPPRFTKTIRVVSLSLVVVEIFAASGIFESQTPTFIIMRWLTTPCLSTTFARVTTFLTSSPRPATLKRFIVFEATSWVAFPPSGNTLILRLILSNNRTLARGSVGFLARSVRAELCWQPVRYLRVPFRRFPTLHYITTHIFLSRTSRVRRPRSALLRDSYVHEPHFFTVARTPDERTREEVLYTFLS